MASYFPKDVLVEIFLRLPVKTLVLCSCLCNSWRDIIINACFITNYSRNQKPLFLKLHPFSSKRYSDDDSDSASHVVEFLDWPYYATWEVYPNFNPGPRMDILGSCNGLVLLSYRAWLSGFEFAIFNPLMPSLIHFATFDCYRSHFFGGLGFDSIANDYKVVISFNEDSLHVYSLNTKSWKEVKYERLCLPPIYRTVFMNGALHWIATSNITNGVYSNLILRFDVSREVFDTIQLPNTIDVENDPRFSRFHMSQELTGQITRLPKSIGVNDEPEVCNFSLAIAFEKLCFGHSKPNGHYCVWIMNEYGVAESWTFLCQVVEPINDFVPIIDILGSHSNGDLILKRYDTKIVSCDPNTNRVKDLGILNDEKCLYMDNFVESLLLSISKSSVLKLCGMSQLDGVVSTTDAHDDAMT